MHFPSLTLIGGFLVLAVSLVGLGYYRSTLCCARYRRYRQAFDLHGPQLTPYTYWEAPEPRDLLGYLYGYIRLEDLLQQIAQRSGKPVLQVYLFISLIRLEK
ncbi:MAG: hypothetical protein IT329_22160 [Caldilineaceae bacterium]|nr:hypothetical protein [Caldilineaceae bacterium]